MPVIPACRRLKQKNPKFKPRLSNLARPESENKSKTTTKCWDVAQCEGPQSIPSTINKNMRDAQRSVSYSSILHLIE